MARRDPRDYIVVGGRADRADRADAQGAAPRNPDVVYRPETAAAEAAALRAAAGVGGDAGPLGARGAAGPGGPAGAEDAADAAGGGGAPDARGAAGAGGAGSAAAAAGDAGAAAGAGGAAAVEGAAGAAGDAGAPAGPGTAADPPVVLVMARGKTARRALQAAAEAGFCACAVYTSDRPREGYLRAAQRSVCLGERFSQALFSNSCAVLDAAEACGADAVLLCDEAVPLSREDGFLACAAARGLLVFTPFASDSVGLSWTRCTTDRPPSEGGERRACPSCGLRFDVEGLGSSHLRCPSCSGLLRMTSAERIADTLDDGSFVEWDRALPERDPLQFPGYPEKLAATRERSGLAEALCTGEGRIAGLRVAVGVMDSKFFMGSMGSVVGEKAARLFDRATDQGLAVVLFCASGGARMQEGLVSLMQMAKVSCAVERHGRAGLLYVSVITDPTTGGVTASFAMQGDVVLAEPGALVGFAGQRVIRDTIRQELPEGFQTAEFALAHGLVDAVVERDELRATLAHLVALHARPDEGRLERGERELLVDYATVCENLRRGTGTYNAVSYGAARPRLLPPEGRGRLTRWAAGVQDALAGRMRKTAGVPVRRLRRAVAAGRFDAEDGALLDEGQAPLDADAPAPARAEAGGGAAARASGGAAAPDVQEAAAAARPAFAASGAEVPAGARTGAAAGAQGAQPPAAAGGRGAQSNPAWESVQLARNTHRPTSQAYIAGMVDGFIELHGDRSFADDAAVVAGVGWIGGRPVTVVSLEKGADLKERIRCNFGCPQPEGYRKSLRLMRQAEKFGRPVVCLVDTQGAFCGTEAEERGQGNAIADNLLALAGLRVPVVSVIVGEGGSGGALALALADHVAMLEFAVYSVLSPEGFASILWKDRTRAPEAAAVMKMSARQARELGVVDEVISEGPAPAHENPAVAVANVRAAVQRALDALDAVPADELVAARHERFARL